MKKYINLAIFIAFAILIVWVGMLRYQVHKLRNQPIQTDTTTIIEYDTLKVPFPVPVVVEVDKPFIVPVQELVFIAGGDSIVIPKEVKTYKDSTYKAIVSGFRPSLDYIEVYQKTINNTVTKTISPSRWGVGLSVGYGFHLNAGKVSPAPFVGVGVYYNLYNLRK